MNHTRKTPYLALFPWMALLLSGTAAEATPYYSEADFLANLPPLSTTSVDFDSLTAGSIVSGTSLNGVNFQASVTDPFGATHQLMAVGSGDSPTRSGTGNSLGTDDAANFYGIQANTPLDFTFDNAIDALGMFFLTPDTMLDGDILLTAGAESVALSVATRELIGNFGGNDWYAYFLGVTTNAAFSTASISYGPDTEGVPFIGTIDDVISRVFQTSPEPQPLPEPDTWALFLLGGGMLALGRRRVTGTTCSLT